MDQLHVIVTTRHRENDSSSGTASTRQETALKAFKPKKGEDWETD